MSHRVIIDYAHWTEATWRMAFGMNVRSARAAGRLLEGRDEFGAFLQFDFDRPWIIQMGPFETDKNDELRHLWMIGAIHGWLNDAIEAIVVCETRGTNADVPDAPV